MVLFALLGGEDVRTIEQSTLSMLGLAYIFVAISTHLLLKDFTFMSM